MIPLLEFHSKLEDEVQEAYDWYEAKPIGLGRQFLLELEAAYALLAMRPKSKRLVYGDVRRWLVNRFPYSVFYRILAGCI